MNTTSTADLADDSPLTYAQIRDAQRTGTLRAQLIAMTPRERVGAAVVCALRTNQPVSRYLVVFNNLMQGTEAEVAR
jgi:hypothetical protein